MSKTNPGKKEQRIKEVMEKIGEMNQSQSTINPSPTSSTKKNHIPQSSYSLFLSDVKSNAEVIFKESTDCSTVDGKFAVITGSINQTDTDNFFQYQLTGSNNAFTFESSILTSEIPMNISYQASTDLIIIFISGVGELATITTSFQNVPFTLTVQKATSRCHFLLTINPPTNEAPVIMIEDRFSSCGRITLEKK